MDQMPVSLCMIAKNEGETIYDALASTLPFVDEYVVGVDNLSTDNTYSEVIRFCNDHKSFVKLYSFKWKDDFSLARNECIGKATGDFIFILDGHEQVVDGHDKLRKYAENPDGNEVFQVEVLSTVGPYATSFFQERMFANDPKYRYQNACHNVMVYDYAVGARLLGVTIHHQRSTVAAAARTQQRREMNYKTLIARIDRGDRRAKAQMVQDSFKFSDWKYAAYAAEEYLKCDMEDCERYQVMLKLGMAYYWLNRIPEAIQIYSLSDQYNTDKRNAHLVFLGELFTKKRNFEVAETFLKRSLQVTKPVSYWVLYPNFYYDIPKRLLEKINDQHVVKSNGTPADKSDIQQQHAIR